MNWTQGQASTVNGSLSKDELIELLDELSERLRRKKSRASIYIVGGAAMALAFDRSRSTHDIDGRIDKGHGALIEAVHEIARLRGLPESWLNDQATPNMPAVRDERARTVYASEYLTVTGASGEHLLGMKLESGRAFDHHDVVGLVKHLEIQTVEEGTGIHRRLFPHSRKRRRAREMMEAAMKAIYSGTDVSTEFGRERADCDTRDEDANE